MNINNINKISVIPNNPNSNDARIELEKNGVYRGWSGLTCIKEINQLLILYISGDIREYQYLAKVTDIDKTNKKFDMELIKKIPSNLSKKFNRNKLLELGFPKDGPVRYYLNTYPQILKYVSDELQNFKIINHPLYENDLFKNSNQSTGGEAMLDKKNKSLNKILYGPPGTGKTYHTINRALEIIDGEFYEENKDNRKALKEKFNEYKENGQIEFITFHQSYGYEEFVEGIKADTDENGNISYEVEDGVFKRVSKEAKKNFIKTTKSKDIKQDFEVVFKERILDKLIENSLKIDTSRGFFEIREINKTTIYFDKSKGDSKHSLSIKTLKDMYEKEDNYIRGGLSGYYNGILNILWDNSTVTKEENEELKNYILIIDEINRGNISKIFGELITLIEESKRLGYDEALEITLPYSGEKFGVPKNLYILGTMNTADRSIALMDTALRRRFDFEEMMPKYDLKSIETNIDGINLQEMLKVINQRIGYLYDRDHMIGHAYFINLKTKEELDNVMRNKIIPLLQEYFYDDWEKIQIVLGDYKRQSRELENIDRFVVAEELKEKSILGFDHEDIEDEKVSYKINEYFTTKAYKKIYFDFNGETNEEN